MSLVILYLEEVEYTLNTFFQEGYINGIFSEKFLSVFLFVFIYEEEHVWRNLYAGQEATVRTGHGTTNCFQRGKGVRQGYILSPCLFNLYGEHIMRNAGLEEAQAGIKIARRNINNLICR